ncbi:MAG: AAA family ATPase, partial [Bacteroidetes bacterium]|nr:AAA family ATPase [Bacteroidota bacterium]
MSELIANLKRYNYWNRNTEVPTGYIRDTQLKRISAYMNNTLIKVLTGQRRSGKSFIMRQLIHLLISKNVPRRNILYLNKEWVEFDEIKTYRDLAMLIELYEKEIKPKGRKYLFIDEVQEIYGWEKTINSYSQNPDRQYEL